MGLTWAAAWALVGVMIGVTSRLLPGLPWEIVFKVFDAPLPALAVPGFVGGVIFSMVLGVAGRGRRFEDLSLARFAAWGAVGGLVLSLVPAAMVAVGLATLGRPEDSVWAMSATICLPLMLLSALSASGSLLLARKAAGPQSVTSGDESTEALANKEAERLLRGTRTGSEHPSAR